MTRDEVARLGRGTNPIEFIANTEVVTARPSSRLKNPGRGGRTYLPRPGRGRDEVGTRDEVAPITGLGRPVRAPPVDVFGTDLDTNQPKGSANE